MQRRRRVRAHGLQGYLCRPVRDLTLFRDVTKAEAFGYSRTSLWDRELQLASPHKVDQIRVVLAPGSVRTTMRLQIKSGGVLLAFEPVQPVPIASHNVTGAQMNYG